MMYLLLHQQANAPYFYSLRIFIEINKVRTRQTQTAIK